MSCFLKSHPRQFHLSLNDCLFSALTGLSGMPYAKRHLELSLKRNCTHIWGHRIIALLESIPVFGGVLALIERISHVLYNMTCSLNLSLKKWIKQAKQLSDIDRSMQKMWKNSQKAIKEHREKNPNAPYVFLRDIPPIQLLEKRKEPLITLGQVAENQGVRRSMQDAHFGKEIEQGRLLGVLDGHGSLGNEVSSYASQEFPQKFSNALKKTNNNVRQAFQQVIDEIHLEVLQQNKWRKSGTTALVCFIEKHSQLIYTATLGDSEANIYRKIKGVFKSLPLSCVRDWNSEKDAKRVNFKWPAQQLRKRRYPRPRDGVNVSRSIGDQKYMQTEEYPGVIQKAKMTVNKLHPGDILILACDGLKDFVEEAEVIAQLDQGDELARRLVDYALDVKKSSDNITVMALQVLDRAQ